MRRFVLVAIVALTFGACGKTSDPAADKGAKDGDAYAKAFKDQVGKAFEPTPEAKRAEKCRAPLESEEERLDAEYKRLDAIFMNLDLDPRTSGIDNPERVAARDALNAVIDEQNEIIEQMNAC